MEKKLVVVINGAPGIGKDTFIEKCKDYIADHYYSIKVYNFSSIQPAVNLAREYHWNTRKDPTSRNMLAEIKQYLDKWFDASFKYITQKIHNTNDYILSIIFVHIREPENIDRLKEYYKDSETIKLITLYIENNDYKIQEGITNSSDLNTGNYNYDTRLEVPRVENKEDIDAVVKELASEYMKNIVIPTLIPTSSMEKSDEEKETD